MLFCPPDLEMRAGPLCTLRGGLAWLEVLHPQHKASHHKQPGEGRWHFLADTSQNPIFGCFGLFC